MPFSLDFIHLGYFFLLVIAIVFLSIEIGFFFGNLQSHKKIHPKDSTIGTIAGATLGLLAFILAFTFGFTASRFENRRDLVLEEANAIDTTYLRAGYLEEPYSGEIRHLLKGYLDLRITASKDMPAEEILKQSDQFLDKLWAHAEVLAKKDPSSDLLALFVESLNNVIEIHSKRALVTLWGRVPMVVWIVLGFLTISSMFGMGYLSGLTGTRNVSVNLMLILSFALVIYLIADLDRPREGLIRTIQQPLIDLQRKISR